MALYSKEQLNNRTVIFKSQLLLEKVLNSNTINTLINLFDTTFNYDKEYNIRKYITEERAIQGLNNSNVVIHSEVYGYNKSHNPTLFLSIQKNHEDFIHLSMHLTPRELRPQKDGILHIFKDIYKKRNESIPKKILYAQISVKSPINKPNSLQFSIASGYITKGISNTINCDEEIQKEMDVIITVLNRIFDEDSILYIGNINIINKIHLKTNSVLHNINTYAKLITRKNKGIMKLPAFNISHNYNNKNIYTHHIKHGRRLTKKIMRHKN